MPHIVSFGSLPYSTIVLLFFITYSASKVEVVVVSGDGAGTTVTMSDTKASSWACSPAAISTLQRKLKKYNDEQ